MSPASHFYFNHQPVEGLGELGVTICYGFAPMERVFNFDPYEGLTGDETKHILGIQANLWTEYVLFPQQAEFMVLPRMAALAEVQWRIDNDRDYANFMARLPRLMDVYDLCRYNYATYDFPERTVAVEGFKPDGD